MLKIMLTFMLASLVNTRLTLHVPAFISTILPPPPSHISLSTLPNHKDGEFLLSGSRFLGGGLERNATYIHTLH